MVSILCQTQIGQVVSTFNVRLVWRGVLRRFLISQFLQRNEDQSVYLISFGDCLPSKIDIKKARGVQRHKLFAMLPS